MDFRGRRGRIDWKEFKEIFNDKYFYEAYKDDKNNEFLHLSMTISLS